MLELMEVVVSLFSVILFVKFIIRAEDFCAQVIRILSKEDATKEVHEPVRNTPEEDTRMNNICKLKKLIKHSSGERAKKLEHILESVCYLEKNGADVGRLHSYYIPEMIGVFHRCKELESSGSVDKKSTKAIKDKAVCVVTTVVDDMVESVADKDLSGIKVDVSVMETVSKQDGYGDDFRVFGKRN